MEATLLNMFFFFNDTATTEIYTLSLHDALPICVHLAERNALHQRGHVAAVGDRDADLAHLPARELMIGVIARLRRQVRSEEHTSELQSRQYLVCRLLLEKKHTTSSFISPLLIAF